MNKARLQPRLIGNGSKFLGFWPQSRQTPARTGPDSAGAILRDGRYQFIRQPFMHGIPVAAALPEVHQALVRPYPHGLFGILEDRQDDIGGKPGGLGQS